MNCRLPLPTLLSHALVAFTIEFDNESERQTVHRTTRHGSTPGSLHAPWLVSLAMWLNCMQFVGEEGVTVRELELLARTKTNLAGMQRWGYIVVETEGGRRKSEGLIRATPSGKRAQEVWRPLIGAIEARWQERFGSDRIDQLHESLRALAAQMDSGLPDCLPILRFGLFSKGPDQKLPSQAEPKPARGASLATLLAKVLLAFAIEFERDSEVSLAIGANILRLVGDEEIPVRDLPRLSSVSKEAIATSLSFLGNRGYAVVEPESPSSRVKLLKLTPKGRQARDAYHRRVLSIEECWRAQFGEQVLSLRESLERLVGDPASPTSPLFRGLEPHPGGWRASIPRAAGLPHYPMVLHRGGFPDGS
jgi:DNA-binding MarR family transcriptional regulator